MIIFILVYLSGYERIDIVRGKYFLITVWCKNERVVYGMI